MPNIGNVIALTKCFKHYLICNYDVLQVLELDNCNLLTSVILDLPRLQNISLVHCRK